MTRSASQGRPGAEPALLTVQPAITATIRRVVSTIDLAQFFDVSFRTLPATISAQGVDIVGPAFCLHHGAAADTVDVEVGFAAGRAIRRVGDATAGSLPGGHVARLIHRGGFDGLAASWARLRSWVQEQGLVAGTTRWEVYLTQPAPDMDPRDLRTELTLPLAG
ncbi:GyrI-like domain-containing protein [Frankia sp. R82]|uniref:GyrI-like domain-containing protein n=1 Tax=Frankia sp. R82 TaxID=2950553 RepID=UPI002044B196|nr:GyrI-like domain-containing protein [Frankia sp. R82]MCM3884823.1 GyrI-like domain-containing protein [Frankia sp. R82]